MWQKHNEYFYLQPRSWPWIPESELAANWKSPLGHLTGISTFRCPKPTLFPSLIMFLHTAVNDNSVTIAAQARNFGVILNSVPHPIHQQILWRHLQNISGIRLAPATSLAILLDSTEAFGSYPFCKAESLKVSQNWAEKWYTAQRGGRCWNSSQEPTRKFWGMLQIVYITLIAWFGHGRSIYTLANGKHCSSVLLPTPGVWVFNTY